MKRDEKSEGKLHNLLESCAFSQAEFFCFDSLSSTNDLAKELSSAGHGQGTLVLADCQTAGRGRMGRCFQSPDQSGLYMSLVLRPDENQQSPGLLTACAAVAVRRAVFELTGQQTDIKWVNDLYYGGKKLCGILAEGQIGSSVALETVILGIGINISVPKEGYAPEISGQAISLAEMPGQAPTFDRIELCAKIVSQFEAIYTAFPQKEFLEEYRAASLVLGKRISYQKAGVRYEGLALAIDDEAQLVVETGGKTESLGTGEVSLVRPL